ncbi:MAG: uncharacterized protein PWP24_1790 [Clostridiales bacterium]|nr:uncharacterized protein [Clostridiales bacterium]
MNNVEPEFIEYISSLAKNETVQEMKQYIQHGDTSTYEHCLRVSYYSYKAAKRLGLNAKACAVGGLLHDLFLYDWHDSNREGKKEFFLPHGFTHGVVAERNARKYFGIDDMCSDIIITHMFPLTIWKVPRYKESYVVLMVDKYISTIEVFRRKKKKSLLTINKAMI